MARRNKPTDAPVTDETADEVTEVLMAEPVDAPLSDADEPAAAADPAPPEPPAPPPAATTAPRRRSPFWPLAFGGLVAAGLGAGASFQVLKTYPDLLGLPKAADTEARFAEINQRLTDLSAELASLPAPTAQTDAEPAIRAATEPLATGITALEGAMANLTARIASLEARPTVAGGTVPPDLAAAAAALKEAEAAAARLQAEADGAARAADVRSALAGIEAALESGQAFGPDIEALSAAGVEVPEALTAVRDGVPTLTQLRDAFPTAARAAIAQSLAATNEGSTWQRIGTFLRGQTGQRSLTPREGDDPDAILSRAEAALAANNIETALAEIAALPTAGQDQMADWSALAAQRLGALQALQTLKGAAQ